MKNIRYAEELFVPTEAEEQKLLFEWVAYQCAKYPELKLLYHIPNEGKRSASGGADLVRQGLKKGVPDICLPVPKGRYHGLYIELKRKKGGKVSTEQKNWIYSLTGQGYKATICRGWEEARAEILAYINPRSNVLDGGFRTC